MDLARLRSAAATVFTAALVAVTVAVVVTLATGDAADSDAVLLTPLALEEARTTVSAPRRAAQANTPDALDLPPGDVAFEGSDDVPETGGLTDLVRTYFGAATVEAIVIVQCESGFDRFAYNENNDGTSDHGLFQINDVHRDSFEPVTGHPWEDRYEAEPNVAFARWLWGHAGGWGPWRCNIRLDGSEYDAPPEDADDEPAPAPVDDESGL